VGSDLRLEDFKRLLREAFERRGGRAIRLMGVGVRFADEGRDGAQLEFDFAPGQKAV
jgi:hypothetical protein